MHISSFKILKTYWILCKSFIRIHHNSVKKNGCKSMNLHLTHNAQQLQFSFHYASHFILTLILRIHSVF